MSRMLWNAVQASPVVFGAFFLIVNSVSAASTLSGEIALGHRVAASTEKSTLFVKLLPQPETQLPQKWVEESNLSPITTLEVSPTVDLADSTVAQVMPEAGAATTGSSSTLEQFNLDSNEGSADDAMDQVTNVSQLRDVSPGDWAYEALRSLVERYGCIAGYPDGTFRGNRAMTRYEFAAGLNACLQQIERLIASSTGEFVKREELETLQRLVQEFQTELTTLGTRVDTLEGRVAFVEDHQFSTTTKLTGNADFGLIDAGGDKRAVPSGQTPTEDLNVNPYFPGRVGLNFDTSFTGRDRLRTKLEAGNFTPLDASITGTDMTLYDFDTRTGPTGNDIVLGTLAYQFPIGDRFIFAMPPRVRGNDVVSRRDLDTSYRVEAFYRYKLTDNISITPGFFMLFNRPLAKVIAEVLWGLNKGDRLPIFCERSV